MAISTGNFPKAMVGGKKKASPGGLSQLFAKKAKKKKC